jgi:uncharacterized protein (DUF433 family)
MIEHLRIEDDIAYVAGHGYLKAEMVARMHVDDQYSLEEVMTHYHLTPSEVHACLVYYYDNQEMLDEEQAQAIAEISANAINGMVHLKALHQRV